MWHNNERAEASRAEVHFLKGTSIERVAHLNGNPGSFPKGTLVRRSSSEIAAFEAPRRGRTRSFLVCSPLAAIMLTRAYQILSVIVTTDASCV